MSEESWDDSHPNYRIKKEQSTERSKTYAIDPQTGDTKLIRDEPKWTSTTVYHKTESPNQDIYDKLNSMTTSGNINEKTIDSVRKEMNDRNISAQPIGASKSRPLGFSFVATASSASNDSEEDK